MLTRIITFFLNNKRQRKQAAFCWFVLQTDLPSVSILKFEVIPYEVGDFYGHYKKPYNTVYPVAKHVYDGEDVTSLPGGLAYFFNFCCLKAVSVIFCL